MYLSIFSFSLNFAELLFWVVSCQPLRAIKKNYGPTVSRELMVEDTFFDFRHDSHQKVFQKLV